MTSINIIAKNQCELNCDISGEYMLAFTGVQGPYNIVILKGGVDKLRIYSPFQQRKKDKDERLQLLVDIYNAELERKANGEACTMTDEELAELEEKIINFVENEEGTTDYEPPSILDGYIGEVITFNDPNLDYIFYYTIWEASVPEDVITNIDYSYISTLVNTMFAGFVNLYGDVLEYDSTFSKFKFNCTIAECTHNFKYVLGIANLPKNAEFNTSYSDFIPVMNGSPYLFIECDKLYSPLRYCWQTKPAAPTKYASVQKIVSISNNNFYVMQPFSLGGNQFKVNGNELRDICFKIVGMYGEAIEFASDLLWSFDLSPLPEEDFSQLPGLLPQDEGQQKEAVEGEQQVQEVPEQ